jgi:hypothetical protein
MLKARAKAEALNAKGAKVLKERTRREFCRGGSMGFSADGEIAVSNGIFRHFYSKCSG